MQNEISTLKNIFDSINIPVSVKWLSECIDWCKSEILNSNYTLDQLKSAIHDQWLSLDLQDIKTSVLPPHLSDKIFMVLEGNFSLQVMKIVDISKPKYWQLQQIRKENVLTRPTGNEIKETIGSGKRVLQLTLTDGVQNVEAVEYKPIPVLNINMPPGIKIRLSGPITIRRGRLLLQEQNIRILGGEVEELLIPNAAENVLARALNLPINNNPNVIDMKLLTVEQESENVPRNHLNTQRKVTPSVNPTVSNIGNTSNLQRSHQNNYSAASTIKQSDFPTDEELELMMNENTLYKRKNDRNANMANISRVKHCAEPSEEELELLMEIENKKIQSNRSTINKTPDLFEDDFNADQIDHLIEVTKIERKADEETLVSKSSNSMNKRQTSSIISEPKAKKKLLDENNLDPNLFEDFVNEDLFADLDLDNLEKKVDSQSKIIELRELKRKCTSGCVGCYKAKAKFKAIEKKVTVQDEEYKAEMRIEDATDDLVCRVHSNVISKWAGLSASEMLNLRKSILSGKVEYKVKVQSILQEIMKKILEVDNVMSIELKGNKSLPVLKEIYY